MQQIRHEVTILDVAYKKDKSWALNITALVARTCDRVATYSDPLLVLAQMHPIITPQPTARKAIFDGTKPSWKRNI